MRVLHADNLSIGYTRRPGRVVAEHLHLSLEAGELVCLLGPNGAGKSTLMRTLAGMQPPLAGSIHLMGEILSQLNKQELARRLSIVLTDRVDVGTLSVFDLVALGRYPYTNWSGRLSDDDLRVVRWAIDLVGAKPLAHRFFHELSDGERQKVMIARALAQEPAVMLLDEPTAFLDLPRRVEIMRTLRKLTRESGRAVLLSTHDLDLALRSADRLWLLGADGQLQTGAPEDLVLNGAFEAAFHSEGVEFDMQTGSFKVATHQGGEVSLSGNDDIKLIWTQRALERAGWHISPTPTAIHIEVTHEWRLTQNGHCTQFMTLYDLLKGIQHE